MFFFAKNSNRRRKDQRRFSISDFEITPIFSFLCIARHVHRHFFVEVCERDVANRRSSSTSSLSLCIFSLSFSLYIPFHVCDLVSQCDDLRINGITDIASDSRSRFFSLSLTVDGRDAVNKVAVNIFPVLLSR